MGFLGSGFEFAGEVVHGHAADAISALGVFDTDPHGERHSTRLMKTREKDRPLITEMSILPMIRNLLLISRDCCGTFDSCGNLYFYIRSLLILLFTERPLSVEI